MPLHVGPLSRRRFLSTTAAAGLGWWARGALSAGERAVQPHRFALLSDTHIAADAAKENRGQNMFNHLRTVVEQVRSLARQPEGLILSGDCAFDTGEDADYAALVELLNPLVKQGLPLHLLMGNHDHRGRFRGAFAADKSAAPLESRFASLVESERANWFLLDSLQETRISSGLLGPEQLAWLGKTIDAHADKPAIVVVHHNPILPGSRGSGLLDTDQLLQLLVPRPHVKALFYGHRHAWQLSEHEGLHLVNLPATSYPGGNQPLGWVDAQLGPQGITLELRSLDPQYPDHGQPRELVWRT